MILRFRNFEFKPSLVPTIVFLTLLPILLGLGNWQMNRAAEKKQLDEDRVSKSKIEHIDLNLTDQLTKMDRYRAAIVSGVYVKDQFWLQDNQVANNRVGYHVYSLLKVDSHEDKYLLVNRGWVPMGDNRDDLPQILIPQGKQVLKGRLDTAASVGYKLGEPAYDLDKVVLYLDIDAFAKNLSLNLFSYALMLDKNQPGLYEYDWEQSAQMTPTKHIGYAFQWFALAAALMIIYIGVNIKQIEPNEEKDCE